MDRQQIAHIANLSRLRLTPEEEIAFAEQLTSILGNFEQLSQLDALLEGVAPTTRAIETVNIMRPDRLKPTENVATLINTAPDRAGEFFRVPQILS